MCLSVKYVPRTNQDGLIVKSFKLLSEPSYFYNYWKTPFFDKKVVNGWLFPRNLFKNKKVYYYNDIINGGFIHSYQKRVEEGFLNKKVFTSYSFFVKAYGKNKDMVSKALFIPKLGSKEDNEKLRYLLSLKRLTTNSIIKQFPKLEKYV